MTGVVLWKELREQRSIWLAMVGAAWLALVGLPITLDFVGITLQNGLREYLVTTLAVLVWTYGLVCGGMLLAGERESGSIHFLDNLPGLRLRLWRSKAVSGLLLVASQVAAVAGLAIAYSLPANVQEIAGGVGVLLAVGLLGYGWGLLVSSNGSNVLTSVALAIFYQPVAALFVYAIVYVAAVMLALFTHHNRHSLEPLVIASVTSVLLILLPLVGSALVFSATDRDRLRSPAHRSVRREKTVQRPNNRVVLWLTYSQSRRLMIGLVICSAIGGFVLLGAGLALWVFGTLLLGVVCGVTVFMDEQTSGSFRFLGDQRLPLGRIWWVKVGYHFLLACAAALILLLPALFRETPNALERDPLNGNYSFLGGVFRSDLLRSLIPPTIGLGLWLFYGFSIGHLCGLLFRRSLIAFVVALMMAAMATSVWLPSMLGGGLHGWQVWGVPVLLMVLARLLMHPWSSDRLLTPGSIGRIVAVLLLCLLWIAGSLWFRVIEVPDVPDRWNMAEFVASLPTPEENKAGQRIRSAAAAVDSWQKQHARLKPTKPLFPGEALHPNTQFTDQLGEVLSRGWPSGKPELDAWLDRIFAAKWPQELAPVPGLPLGMMTDPRNETFRTFQTNFLSARSLCALLAVRGLQLQERGDSRAFVTNLRIGLAVSRNLRHNAIVLSDLVGWVTEADLLRGVERWLERLDGDQKAELRQVRDLLLHHEAELSDEETQTLKAEYLLAKNSLDLPELFYDGYRAQDIDMIRLAGQVPWERQRQLRILRACFEGTPQELYMAQRASPPELARALGDQSHLTASRKVEQARLHAAQLEVALRLYQAETGKPATSLAVLTPKYLPHIPADPFDGRPFRYRLSKDERLAWVTDTQGFVPQQRKDRLVPPGQGILWSIGADGKDDGGRRQALVPVNREPGEDLIFLVPLPPRKDK